MGDWPDSTKASRASEWSGVAVLALLMTLPSLLPGQLGWLQGLVPMTLCYYLIGFGERRGRGLVVMATLLAGLTAAAVGTLPAFVFTCTMLPVGILLGREYQRGTSPPRTGLTAVLLLVLLWTGFWAAYGALTRTNPYQEMLTALDKSLAATSSFYQQDSGLSLDTKAEIESTIRILRDGIQQVVPALLLMTAVATVWVNLLLSHWLVSRFYPDRSSWPPFRDWRLPEQLVWAVIAAGAALLLPVPRLATLGLNLLLICGALYFWQGLAVLAKLFTKWSVPRPMRAFLYAIALLQGAGFVALAALGVADIWVGFGSRHSDDDPSTDHQM